MLNVAEPKTHELEKGLTFKVHDHGFIRVVDFMGDDNAVVQMARISYGAGTKTPSEDRALIRYLMRHRHTSPFEGCEIKLHIKMPIFVMRQWVRHRMANLNEVSARYSELPGEFYIPALEDVRAQSTVNKQGGSEPMTAEDAMDFVDSLAAQNGMSDNCYRTALSDGVARETARLGLPVNIYTEIYWKIDLHNLFHFLKLRTDRHAQKEIRDYADVIADRIVRRWVPYCHEAWVDYSQMAHTFSRIECLIVRDLFARMLVDPAISILGSPFIGQLSAREQKELLEFFKPVEI